VVPARSQYSHYSQQLRLARRAIRMWLSKSPEPPKGGTTSSNFKERAEAWSFGGRAAVFVHTPSVAFCSVGKFIAFLRGELSRRRRNDGELPSESQPFDLSFPPKAKLVAQIMNGLVIEFRVIAFQECLSQVEHCHFIAAFHHFVGRWQSHDDQFDFALTVSSLV
jgi:hypothetical protein